MRMIPAMFGPLARVRRAALGAVIAVAALAPSAACAEASVIDRLSEYLNSVSTMSGAFIQVAPDGSISEGKFSIRRPGRMRFEYNPPNETIVVADGFWAAVLDKKDDRSIDRFPLRETPLYFLLKDDVDLNAEGVIRDVSSEDGQHRVTAVDPSGDTQGELTMIFDADPIELKQWIVTDPQGLTTTIVLRTAEINGPVANELFVIPNTTIGADSHRD